jgi:hypothetical protein
VHGERGFRDVAQVLHRHPILMRMALWLQGRGAGEGFASQRANT